jgi:hypothetical protein
MRLSVGTIARLFVLATVICWKISLYAGNSRFSSGNSKTKAVGSASDGAERHGLNANVGTERFAPRLRTSHQALQAVLSVK